MKGRGAVPLALARALRPPPGKCYHHCGRLVRATSIASPLPGRWQVYACPSGVVSVTSYVEWTRRDPSAAARAFLARRTIPATAVRARDLRLATRHGPELGRPVEQILRAAERRPMRVVYWRLYPFKARDGTERRLFVCLRRRHTGPVFFPASPTDGRARCPVCAAGRKRRARSQRPAA